MKTQTGFTLIEVLIAMLLLAVGLLGLAALQTFSLKNNHAAYHHGQATQLLYDMSDRMRSNVGMRPWDANSKAVITSYLTVNPSPYTADCKTATGCTRTQLAINDLLDWNNAIVAALPMGRGSVSANPNPITDSSVFTLSITWDDDRNGVVDSNDPSFSMELKL